MELLKQLENYNPYNEQEAADVEMIKTLLATQPDIFIRENLTAHMTASSWLVNRTHDKVLLIYHNIYNSWAWTGGHADGERDLLAVAVREAQEETGVMNIRPVSSDIFSVEALTVDGHEKRGSYVPSHLHLNVTYLLEADEEEVLRVKPDENSGVKWFSLEEALEASTEPWMTERIYTKLNKKLEKWHTSHSISDETIESIGILAKLELSGEEKQQAKQDMEKMLIYVDRLNEVDTTDVEPLTHIFPVSNVFREDIVENGDGSTDTLSNAPEQRNGGFVVPKTIT